MTILFICTNVDAKGHAESKPYLIGLQMAEIFMLKDVKMPLAILPLF